jgi:hypothetical protein
MFRHLVSIDDIKIALFIVAVSLVLHMVL